jgi:methyl-accepting chemotaxis protein
MFSDSGRPQLHISAQQPWFAVLSRMQRALVGVVVGAFIFLSGGVLDWFVTRQYLPRISLMLAGAAVALAVGLLVFQILTDIGERYQAMVDRLRRIVELNHHIRNALQVIAYYNVPERTERAIQQVNAEIVRIESVLREVSAALGEHADVSDAVVPTQRRNR